MAAETAVTSAGGVQGASNQAAEMREHPSGTIGEADVSHRRMVAGVNRLRQIEDSVIRDSMNSENYSQETSKVTREIAMDIGAMFQEERLGITTAIAEYGGLSSGEKSAGAKQKGVMEYKAITNLKPVNGEAGSVRGT